MQKEMKEEILLNVEELEERIAPTPQAIRATTIPVRITRTFQAISRRMGAELNSSTESLSSRFLSASGMG